MNFTTRIDSALAKARESLLAAQTTEGCWEGELSGNAFSTAAAVIAFRSVEQSRPQFGISKLRSKITAALDWLVANANADGGWGDVHGQPSKLVPTACAWAALADAAETDRSYQTAAQKAELCLNKTFSVGEKLSAASLAARLTAQSGDPVLVSSVLTLCAISGRFGSETEAWRHIPALPFESVSLPMSWFSDACFSTIDSASPALIAVGQLIHFRNPTGNPIRRPIRDFAVSRTLKSLEKTQIEGGGFMESIPLTSIVLASMAASGRISNPVAKPAMEFLMRTQRSNGSWALTSNISVTVTSMALNALASPGFRFRADDAQAWLMEQQFQSVHPFSGASPGGWGWTNAPGCAPEAHDTALALLALWRIRPVIAVPRSEKRYAAAVAGINWLFEVQNADGGIATFSKSKAKNPLCAGSPDLTAAAMRAWIAWRPELPSVRSKLDNSLADALQFLKKSQRPDGSWAPLWFAAQSGKENLIYGTSRVLLALADLSKDAAKKQLAGELIQRGVKYLLACQRSGGEWTSQEAQTGSAEETAWSLEALAAVSALETNDSLNHSIDHGAEWLAEKTSAAPLQPAALGLFYSPNRYSERLFPIISAIAALKSVVREVK